MPLLNIRQYILPFIVSLIAAVNILGFVRPVEWLYPSTMSILLFYMLSKRHIRVYFPIVFFLFICILSIVINNPNSVFRSWERLAYFCIILVDFSPIVYNSKMNLFRMKIFNITVVLLVVFSVVSFICYFLGLNFMRDDGSNITEIVSGAFSGMLSHSMILGPVAALSSCYLCSCLFHSVFTKKIKFLIFAGFIASVGALLLSASRGALVGGILGLIFVLYKLNSDRIGRFVKYLILFVGVVTVSFPLWTDIANMMMTKQENNIQSGSIFSSRESKWRARQAEFESSPLFGIGFASISTNGLDKYSEGGVIEPGSSWGGLLSMLGLLGFLSFCYIVIANFLYLLRDRKHTLSSAYLGGCFIFFVVHLIIEGYLLAAGSYLCFLFWLLLGVIVAQRKNDIIIF